RFHARAVFIAAGPEKLLPVCDTGALACSSEEAVLHGLSHRDRRCEYSTVCELNIQPVPNFIKGYAQTVRQNKSPAHAVQPTSVDVEDDHEFRDFIESITVTKDELAAIVSSP